MDLRSKNDASSSTIKTCLKNKVQKTGEKQKIEKTYRNGSNLPWDYPCAGDSHNCSYPWDYYWAAFLLAVDVADSQSCPARRTFD